jgi:hypothetical protein
LLHRCEEIFGAKKEGDEPVNPEMAENAALDILEWAPMESMVNFLTYLGT